MKVLIIGAGGREHALAWAACRSPMVSEIYVAPGNAGTSAEPKTTNVSIAPDDLDALAAFALRGQIDLTIVGPEVPLTMGIADVFQSRGLACFGPSASAARLEGSKQYAKQFMMRHGIATAPYSIFHEVEAAVSYARTIGFPVVIKADGLAAGKGVVIAQNVLEAQRALSAMLQAGQFGAAGKTVVIEQFIAGEEASFICLVDGADIVPLATSQDHKAVHDGDTGPNTGGMGAYSPAPVINAELERVVLDEVIRPAVQGLAQENIRYRGFLYAGLMIDRDGKPHVLEFNCRLGDPETQPIMMRLQSDLIELICAALSGSLAAAQVQWQAKAALGVVLAAKGYPESCETGAVIREAGLPYTHSRGEVKIFHAGTDYDADGNLVVSGGRVACVTALGDDVTQAQALAYQSVRQIRFEGMHCRTDIGNKAIYRTT